MNPPDSGLLLGRIAVIQKMITMDQLVETTLEQGKDPTKRLGDILVGKGFIDQAQLQHLLALQRQYQARLQAGAPPPGQPASPGEGPPPAARAARREATRSTADRPTPPAAATRAPRSPADCATPADTGRVQPVARPSPGLAPSAPPPNPRLDALLAKAVELRASDVHVHSGAPIRMRIHGRFVDAGKAPLSGAESESLLLPSLSEEQRRWFDERGELDFAYTLPGVGRFRANLYRQLRGLDAVFRAIPPSPPGLTELGLPSTLAKLTNYHQGLVLLTGPAGCGKSSTLAALLNIINEERRDHILTVEDPIEHLHPSKRCVVNQRQVNLHTESFARALRAALREDPDVIAIGELRDLETISLAITAAETGHLVLATLHTNSATRTVNRLLGVFPPDQQPQVRAMLSESLRAIVSQRLVPTADNKGRVAALEVLICNKAVANLIRDDKTFQIRSVLQTGQSQGMCLLDGSLAALVRSGAITRDEALRHCDDPRRFLAPGAAPDPVSARISQPAPVPAPARR